MSGRDDVELGHHCARCGGLASVYVTRLELGVPAGESVSFCKKCGADDVLGLVAARLGRGGS